MAGVSGTFTSSTASAALKINGRCPLSLSGSWSAFVVLQRSFDGGSSWKDVETFTANVECVVNGTGELYRLNCTFTSGTVTYRLGAPE